ncbi:MAG: glycosyl transferase [Candidatus Altiarchaeales archaeon ex4484_96]|nr:MAG: glycosyl transferase [Candidatus Altiarchaeales archaeon ex4484_96]
MKVSVIIPAYNEEKDIGKCLKSIKENKYKNFDVIVVDAGSTDKTIEIAKEYTDRVLSVHTSAPGPARNIGVKESDAEVVAFTDADTVVAANWVAEMAAKFTDPDVVGVGGVLRPLEPRLLDKIMFKINSDLWYRFTAIFGFFQLGTPNCAYRRDAFLEVGGFDETMSMLEDTELSLRMGREKRGKIIIDKSLIAYNSARRFKQEGYLRVFLRYLKAYFNMFTKRGVKSEHFDVIDH